MMYTNWYEAIFLQFDGCSYEPWSMMTDDGTHEPAPNEASS